MVLIVPGSPEPVLEPEPVELAYAGLATPAKAESLIHGGARPIPVIARPTKDVARLDASWRGNVWWLLLVMMLPLAWLTFQKPMTLEERIARTAEKHPQLGKVDTQEMTYQQLDEIFEALPDRKLDGAFLPRRSVFPLLFALVSAAVFVMLCAYAIPAPSNRPDRALYAGLFTGTLGVMLLLGIQSFGLFCFIHAFYLAALHPDAPFGASLIGFVLGVGICEEVIKVIPILFIMWRGNLLNWRQACVIGMASGAGFGVSEGILYSFQDYNGIDPASIYVVRFASCVAFHTLLSGACAMMIYRKQEHLLEDMDPINWLLTLAAIILIPIVLHGLFNTLAKKEMDGGALAVAIGSFAWVALLIRGARKREESVALAEPAGPKFVQTARGTVWVSPPGTKPKGQ